MQHDALAASLAAHLRCEERMVWTDLQLGPAHSPRPDVYTMFKSFVRPQPTAYEVKASVADFRRDVTSGKWQTYLKYATGVYFACEGDLIKPSDVPTHCGLIVYRTAWRVARKAVLAPVNVPADAFIKLLIAGVAARRHAPRTLDESKAVAAIRRKFGDDVADCLRDWRGVRGRIDMARSDAERILEHARREAEEVRDTLTQARVELCDILTCNPDATPWRIKQLVANLRRGMSATPAREQLKTLTKLLRRALDTYGWREE